jgi:hypothetical protein
MEGRLPGAAANHLHPGVNAEVAFTTLRDWAVAAGEKRMMGEVPLEAVGAGYRERRRRSRESAAGA